MQGLLTKRNENMVLAACIKYDSRSNYKPSLEHVRIAIAIHVRTEIYNILQELPAAFIQHGVEEAQFKFKFSPHTQVFRTIGIS